MPGSRENAVINVVGEHTAQSSSPFSGCCSANNRSIEVAEAEKLLLLLLLNVKRASRLEQLKH
jgi:hypothetical protein